MTGGGGTTGSVEYPHYIMDTHASLLGGTTVDDQGAYSPAHGGAFVFPAENVSSIFNALIAISTSVYDAFIWTDPATKIAANQSQWDLYYAGVTAFSSDNYADYIADAILAIGNSTTVPIADMTVSLSTSALSTPQVLFPSFSTTSRNEAALSLTKMFANVQPDVRALMIDAPSTAFAAKNVGGSTTLWDSLIDQVSTKLQTCGIPKDANLMTVLSKAANDAETNLRTAILLAQKLIDDDILSNVVAEFAARREITYGDQHRQYAGTMADINAINSTGFLFGVALLKSEQMREVSEFDASLTLEQFKEGLQVYVQLHSDALSAGTTLESLNATAHNTLLQASVQLVSDLSIRAEIRPTDLLELYGQFFAMELGMFDNTLRDGVGNQTALFGVSSGDSLRRDSGLAQLSAEASRINKVAKESRYSMGMNQIQSLLANRVQFEHAASALQTDGNRVGIVLGREYEQLINERTRNDYFSEVELVERTMALLVAPGGMGSPIPFSPSMMQSVMGGALEGAGAGAAIGFAAGGPPGALIGAGVGGVAGGVAGLIGS